MSWPVSHFGSSDSSFGLMKQRGVKKSKALFLNFQTQHSCDSIQRVCVVPLTLCVTIETNEYLMNKAN